MANYFFLQKKGISQIEVFCNRHSCFCLHINVYVSIVGSIPGNIIIKENIIKYQDMALSWKL